MDTQKENQLTARLSRTGAWAFSLGTSVGWGMLVVTNSACLAKAGPLGSVLGIVVGALIMLVIGCSYAYLMNCYPDAGGAYAFSRDVFGYDVAFLTAWFLVLTYLAILWANATSLPLFARYFLGDLFRFGGLWRIFGYDVWTGEVLLSVAVILLTALLCARARKLTIRLMIAMVFLFTAGILICVLGAVFQNRNGFSPAFVPEKNVLGQIARVALISPWAFIGFESVSHASQELSFPRKRIFRIFAASVFTAAALYIAVTLLSVTAYPARYGNWLAYIRDLDNLTGIEALPAFYAVRHYLGGVGVGILMASLLSLILTSLIGNFAALSRLCFALGRDGVLPASLGELNRQGKPGKAVWAVAAVSVLIPFFGRTAVGWIVDVTTLGATMVYGIVCAAAFKESGFRSDRLEKQTGFAGLVLMICFLLYLLVPNLFTKSFMEPASYFLLVIWALLGFVVFRRVLKRDEKERFGRTAIVWIALLSLILFGSLVWMNQSIMNATDSAMSAVGVSASGETGELAQLVERQMATVRTVSARSIAVVVLVFALSLAVLMINHRLMTRRAEHSQRELGMIRDLVGRDALTGVKSKLAYSETEKEIDERIAAGTEEEFALAVMDLNGLKHVNDTQGHQAGDDYIRKASRMICMYFAHSPVYRVGGDEFVALMRGRDFENRETILEMFRRESEAHISSGDVVVSVGSADYLRETDRNLRAVFERADTRMYEHKNRLRELGAVTRL